MFYDPSTLAFARALESHAATIRAELDTLCREDFEPWIERGLYEGDAWTVFPFFSERVYDSGPYAGLVPQYADNARRCPKTCALLRGLPGCVRAGFSRMAPGARIVPHCGDDDSLYRCHLCLIEAEDCALAFEHGETRSWRTGECLVFEDTLMHEAWNRGTGARVVLLADFEKAAYGG